MNDDSLQTIFESKFSSGTDKVDQKIQIPNISPLRKPKLNQESSPQTHHDFDSVHVKFMYGKPHIKFWDVEKRKQRVDFRLIDMLSKPHP